MLARSALPMAVLRACRSGSRCVAVTASKKARVGSKVIEQAADAIKRCFDVGREKRGILSSEICWG